MVDAYRRAYPLPRIHSMGPMLFDPVWALQAHPATNTEVLHVLRGELELDAPGGPYPASEGDTLLQPAGTMHRDAFDLETGVEIFFCSLDWPPDAVRRYFGVVDNDSLLALDARSKAAIHAVFQELAVDLKSASAGSDPVASARLYLVLMLALRGVERSRQEVENLSYGQARRRDLLERARKYVLRHFHEPLTLDRVAAALQVSGYHLSHVFSQESDLSLFSFLAGVRMDRARELLAHGELNVSEVALAVGYRDANYFSKAFRKHCGCSPREFRAAALGERE